MPHQATPAVNIHLPIPSSPIVERDAARRIGMSVAYLRQVRRQGRGPAHFRLGRAVRYRIADIDAWLSVHRVSPSDQRTEHSG